MPTAPEQVLQPTAKSTNTYSCSQGYPIEELPTGSQSKGHPSRVEGYSPTSVNLAFYLWDYSLSQYLIQCPMSPNVASIMKQTKYFRGRYTLPKVTLTLNLTFNFGRGGGNNWSAMHLSHLHGVDKVSHSLKACNM